MKTLAHYQQVSNYTIATEILSDPEATTRERVMAQRIRGQHGEQDDNKHYAEHKYD